MDAMLEALLASITYVNGFAIILFSFFCTLFGKRGFYLMVEIYTQDLHITEDYFCW